MTTPSLNARLHSAAVALVFAIGAISRPGCPFYCHGFQLCVSLDNVVNHNRPKCVSRDTLNPLPRSLTTFLKASPESSSRSSKVDDNSDKSVQALQQKASKLRQEADKLESTLRNEDKARAASSRKNQPQKPLVATAAIYKNMSDSTWTFTYRFAGEFEPNNEEEDPVKGNKAVAVVPKFSGKLTLHLRSDGFTDIIKHEPVSSTATSSSSSSSMSSLDIVKAWGWDLETSSEDDKEYLLLSIDAMLPSSSGHSSSGGETGREKRRFYMQARQDRETSSGAIFLQGGTVTVKQDVSTKAGSAGFWDRFVPKGILARFRYVGDFAARPTLRETS